MTCARRGALERFAGIIQVDPDEKTVIEHDRGIYGAANGRGRRMAREHMTIERSMLALISFWQAVFLPTVAAPTAATSRKLDWEVIVLQNFLE